MISKGRVIRTGLFFSIANFLITAALGVMLRYQSLYPIEGFVERFWIHAHSHTGFLGWIFLVLMALSFALLLPKNGRINRKFYRLLIYLQLAVLGMLVTFPFMGYAAPSIFFSTIHMILSIVFVLAFYRNADDRLIATRYMKAGLIFMLISGIGPLALGPIIVMDLRESNFYDMAIYFYLHFQYNGWFTLAIFALFLQLMHSRGLSIPEGKGKLLYRLLVVSVIMTLALSALGFEYAQVSQIVGGLGAAIQLWAGFIFLKLVFMDLNTRRLTSNHWVRWFFGVALFSWLLKIMMQFLSAIPAITNFVYLSRDAIMTYLHLAFLGFSSCFIVGLLIEQQYLKTTSLIARFGYLGFIVSVIAMEITIGLRAIPQYLSIEIYQFLNGLLLIESILLFVSIFCLLFFGFIFSNRTLGRRYPRLRKQT